MQIYQDGPGVAVTGLDSFDIGETLECGQCFRFVKTGDNSYIIIARGRVITACQRDGALTLTPCGAAEFEAVWRDYFDLNTDYGRIKDALSGDPVLREAAAFAAGIRILNQDPWECLISFIISQNNRIPQIKRVISNLSLRYGEPLGEYGAFPTPQGMRDAQIDDLTACRMGFRAKYISDAVARTVAGELDFAALPALRTAALREKLTSVHGVGAKVADCTMLFGFGRREVFPVDVWIKRVMEHYYFGGKNVPIRDISAFAAERFGALAGYAQQYLFHFARVQKIGK